MNNILNSNTAFKKHYSNNPLVIKGIAANVIGLGTGGAVVGASVHGATTAAAATATSSGVAGVLSHFAAVPFLGTKAAAYVAATGAAAASSAVAPAILAALPLAVLTTLGAGTTLFFVSKKVSIPYQKGTGLETLAETISDFIFLPFFASCNEIILKDPELKGQAILSAKKKILEWGYKESIADNLIGLYLGKINPSDLRNNFNVILNEISELKKGEFYKGVMKEELPVKAIRKIAESMEINPQPAKTNE